jgi:penicillin amidase
MFKDYWGMHPLFMYNVLRNHDGQGRWCDDVATDETETCRHQLAASLTAALTDLSERYGDDMEKWRWGDAHFAHSDHKPFSGQPVIGDLFDIKVPSPGGTYTIDVGRYDITDAEQPFANVHAPSLRAIYDLSDPNRSIFMQSTGQSGNRLSPYYANFAEPWSNVQYVPMTTKRSDFEAGAIGTLILQPAN